MQIITAFSRKDVSGKDGRDSQHPDGGGTSRLGKQCFRDWAAKPTAHTALQEQVGPLARHCALCPSLKIQGLRSESPTQTWDLEQGKELAPLDSGVGGWRLHILENYLQSKIWSNRPNRKK